MNVVSMSAQMTGTYRTYPDLVSTPPFNFPRKIMLREPFSKVLGNTWKVFKEPGLRNTVLELSLSDMQKAVIKKKNQKSAYHFFVAEVSIAGRDQRGECWYFSGAKRCHT